MEVVPKKKAHHHPVKLMGCGFVLTAIHEDPQVAWDAIRGAQQEIERIENLISSWSSDSETSMINKNAGIQSVKVSEELLNLIERSIKISKLTFGAFDISGTLGRYYWNFNKEENIWLPQDKLQELRQLVDYKNISLRRSDSSVFLHKKGMKIGFGGIGKGYAAQMAKNKMLEMGIKDGLINASGDLLAWGNPIKTKNWSISIPNPKNRDLDLLSIDIHNGSVVTSGSYENYTIVDGKRYSHIINPRTGTPVHHTKNVTVICPDAEFGDAIATALSVLPIKEGINLVNLLSGVECIIVDSQDEVHYSQQLNMSVAV